MAGPQRHRLGVSVLCPQGPRTEAPPPPRTAPNPTPMSQPCLASVPAPPALCCAGTSSSKHLKSQPHKSWTHRASTILSLGSMGPAQNRAWKAQSLDSSGSGAQLWGSPMPMGPPQHCLAETSQKAALTNYDHQLSPGSSQASGGVWGGLLPAPQLLDAICGRGWRTQSLGWGTLIPQLTQSRMLCRCNARPGVGVMGHVPGAGGRGARKRREPQPLRASTAGPRDGRKRGPSSHPRDSDSWGPSQGLE